MSRAGPKRPAPTSAPATSGCCSRPTTSSNTSTVAGNVAFARRLAGHRDDDAVRAVLREVGVGPPRRARPTHLSGGELARAGLAVALANDPDVILADEPTGELDDETATRLLAVLRARADRGAAVVIVTHDPVVARHADRRLTLTDGRADDMSIEPARPPDRGQPPTFGDRASAVDAVTFDIFPGDRIAVIGPSGSGKSTLLHLIAGLDAPTDGHHRLAGARAGTAAPRTGRASCSRPPACSRRSTSRENVALPLLLTGEAEATAARRAGEVLARLGLADLARHLPDELSGGQAQRVALARAIASRPRLIARRRTDRTARSRDRDGIVIDALLDAAERDGQRSSSAPTTRSSPLDCSTHWTMHDGRLVEAQPASR